MGRFKHENCEMAVARDGYIVAYMGDDERGEHLYKFVSSGTYRPGMDNPSSLLEDGTLYAARFDEDGTGLWLALTPETTGMDTAETCIHTRQAATAAGATTMGPARVGSGQSQGCRSLLLPHQQQESRYKRATCECGQSQAQ